MNSDDQQRLDRIEKKVDDIKDNHLANIYRHLGKQSGKLAVLIPLVIAIIGLTAGLYFYLLR